MTTLHTPFGGAAAFDGEIVCWQFPAGVKVTHAALVGALQTAGLDPAGARSLAARHAFVRAVKKLADKRIVRNLEEDRFTITFQFTAEQRVGGQFAYQDRK